jgi:hypothetical protein
MSIPVISAFPRSIEELGNVDRTISQHLSVIEALDDVIQSLTTRVRRLQAQKFTPKEPNMLHMYVAIEE